EAGGDSDRGGIRSCVNRHFVIEARFDQRALAKMRRAGILIGDVLGKLLPGFIYPSELVVVRNVRPLIDRTEAIVRSDDKAGVGFLRIATDGAHGVAFPFPQHRKKGHGPTVPGGSSCVPPASARAASIAASQSSRLSTRLSGVLPTNTPPEWTASRSRERGQR